MGTFKTAALLSLVAATGLARHARADDQFQQCNLPPGLVATVQSQLATVVTMNNGGFFSPNRMWSAVVDRKGRLCSVISNSPDAWPGSRSIAIAKASTANDFSNNQIALSTANLYAPTQPGGSLYGLNNSNPFNPAYNAQGTGIGAVTGGIITFGGGVALYLNGQVIGGLGVSGDSSCADHAISYRMRHGAGLDHTPTSDNIQYAPVGVPPTGFEQPHCISASTDVMP